MVAYIREYINTSNRLRLSQHFNLFSNNCNTNQFRLLDTVMGSSYTVAQKKKAAKVPLWDPEKALEGLLVRNLFLKEIAPHESEPEARAFLDLIRAR